MEKRRVLQGIVRDDDIIKKTKTNLAAIPATEIEVTSRAEALVVGAQSKERNSAAGARSAQQQRQQWVHQQSGRGRTDNLRIKQQLLVTCLAPSCVRTPFMR
jgi:hypothetical protein